jgi:hypothetical protein
MRTKRPTRCSRMQSGRLLLLSGLLGYSGYSVLTLLPYVGYSAERDIDEAMSRESYSDTALAVPPGSKMSRRLRHFRRDVWESRTAQRQ